MNENGLALELKGRIGVLVAREGASIELRVFWRGLAGFRDPHRLGKRGVVD